MPFDALRTLTGAATRHETPCGTGTVVWHSWGREGDAPVVLLHGGSGSWNHWVRNVSALVEHGFWVLAPDLPGFGDSDLPPVGFDADAHVEWILMGIKRLLGERPYDLVAFSFGCMVAAFIASRQPSRVLRLVLVGAPALTAERRPSLRLKAWKSHPPGPERDDAHKHNLGVVMLLRPDLQPALALRLHVSNVERDRIPHRRLFLTDVVAKLLPSITAPLWAVWGLGDALHMGSFERYASVLCIAPRFQAMTLIPRAGHWVQFEAPGIFNRTLLDVLRSDMA